MHIILETPRLILRRFTEADAPLVFALNSDAEVLKYLQEPPIKDEAHAIEIVRSIILPQYNIGLGRWAVHVKDTDSFIGWCGLKHRPELDEIDLGYRYKKSAWGNGFATEAAMHTLAYGFKKLNLNIITGRAHIENIASQKVLENIGMKFIREEIIDDCPVKTYNSLG